MLTLSLAELEIIFPVFKYVRLYGLAIVRKYFHGESELIGNAVLIVGLFWEFCEYPIFQDIMPNIKAKMILRLHTRSPRLGRVHTLPLLLQFLSKNIAF